jgi:hypothetical protein
VNKGEPATKTQPPQSVPALITPVSLPIIQAKEKKIRENEKSRPKTARFVVCFMMASASNQQM